MTRREQIKALAEFMCEHDITFEVRRPLPDENVTLGVDIHFSDGKENWMWLELGENVNAEDVETVEPKGDDDDTLRG